MRNRVRLGLAVVAFALSAPWAHAVKVTPLDDGAAKFPGPDVAKTPSPGGPVPVPYPNIKKQEKKKEIADKKKELLEKKKDIVEKRKELGPKFDDKNKKPIEIVKPDVPKPEKIPPVDVVKRPPQTPPLRPVEVPHPVKLPQPVLRPVELPAKPVLPIQPIEPVKLPQPIKVEQPVKAQPVILQPAMK